MTNIQEYSNGALLSHAAYANFVNKEDIKEALMHDGEGDNPEGPGFTSAEAELLHFNMSNGYDFY